MFEAIGSRPVAVILIKVPPEIDPWVGAIEDTVTKSNSNAPFVNT